MLDMAPIPRVVDERADVHPVSARKMLEQVERADFIALVGWIRDPMRQKQQLPHWLSQISRDERADPDSERQRQLLPQLDEQAVSGVERVVLGRAFSPDLLEIVRINPKIPWAGRAALG